MLDVVESSPGFERLRDLVQEFVDQGVPIERLVEDLDQIRGLVTEEQEDSVLDVMDLLVGYCAPQLRILPRTAGHTEDGRGPS